MANDVKVLDAISKEILRYFMVESVVANTVCRQYDDSKSLYGANQGSTLRIKQPQRVEISDGATLVIQDLEEREITLAKTKQKQISLAFTAAEMSQDLLNPEGMAMFSNEYLKASMNQACAELDAECFEIMSNSTYNSIGTPGSNPSSYADITAAKSLLGKYNVPRTDRHFVLTTDSMGALNAGTQGIFNPSSEKNEDYRSGKLANTNGFTFWETDFLPRHLNGDATDTSAVIAVSGTEGASSISTSGWGATETITKGTHIEIGGVYRANLVSKVAKADLQQFIVTADTTAVAGVMTIPVSPALEATGAYKNVSSLPAAGAAITIKSGDADTAYDLNLFYHKDAFVLAFQDLKNIGSSKEAYIRDEKLGISMKLTMDSDIVNFRSIARLDFLYGFEPLCPWQSGKIWGA